MVVRMLLVLLLTAVTHDVVALTQNTLTKTRFTLSCVCTPEPIFYFVVQVYCLMFVLISKCLLFDHFLKFLNEGGGSRQDP